MGGVIASGLTYAPGANALLERNGEAFGNLWRDARIQPVPGDASPWLDHLARLIPEEWEREHLLNVLRDQDLHLGLQVMLYHYSFHYLNVCGLDYTISFLFKKIKELAI